MNDIKTLIVFVWIDDKRGKHLPSLTKCFGDFLSFSVVSRMYVQNHLQPAPTTSASINSNQPQLTLTPPTTPNYPFFCN